MKINIEHTDTFGGESNYAWVNRATAELPDNATDAQVKRAAKKALGLSGIRGAWSSWGEMLSFVPSRFNEIVFITFEDVTQSHTATSGKGE